LENKAAHSENKVADLENKFAHSETKVAHLENKVVQLARALEESIRTLDETRRETTTLRARLTAIDASTIWRATKPLRIVATRVPAPIRRHLRQIAKAGYWVMTPHKIPAWIAFIRQRNQIQG
jgi:septal ring factor EnvC (AmiA/AmiB activator)